MTPFEESNPCDVDINELLELLNKHFKHVKREDVRFFYHGTYNVFEFRNYILRIPDVSLRNELGIELIQNEVMKLKNLSKLLDIPIPNPHLVDTTSSLPFMAYEKLPGFPLSTIYSSLNPQQILKIASEIADFLNYLHSPATLHRVNARIFQTNFHTLEFKEFWEKHFEEIQVKIFPLLNSSQKLWVKTLFNSYLLDPENFSFQYAVIHGDFDSSNILVDPVKTILTGIVDFEESRAWDPVADLLFFEEPLLYRKILESYRSSASPTLSQRMRFMYCRTFAPYILFGLDHQKPAMVKYGLMKLERLRQEFPYP
jgi:aminoglycoside 2''-phosphotransferase